MSLIFDSFPSHKEALDFGNKVKAELNLNFKVFATVEEAQSNDPIPTRLQPPIVHVERARFSIEQNARQLVEQFGGEFVGT